MSPAGIGPRDASPLVLAGTPEARGRGQAQGRRAEAARVREATVGRVALAREEGLLDQSALAYLAAQRAFHEAHDPSGMAELSGIAEAFELPLDALFVHLHLGTLRDFTGGAVLEDGCSAWAVSDGPEGPLAVKNRDYSGAHLGIQHVARHSGPDVKTGSWLAVGSLGSPGAYSSGMNACGLAVVDTQVSVRTHRVGWLRYFLMSRLLSKCADVAEALDFIRGVSHAGGGTLVLADKGGAVAAVELGARETVSVTDAPVWRTNHYVSPELAADTLAPGDDRIAQNSRDRFRYLGEKLPHQDWNTPTAARLMATHPDTEEAAAPLCQHAAGEASQTLSTAIYSCRLGVLTFSEGNPCAGRWLRYSLPK
ncbi:C45 family peptidase [Maritimibacter sp. HL-12]|uniref:C45 family autoproteolytic acyltransferase/hydolase n=1 Tax=Maritimibacter sp. HL-12 TaxID=1162418 RepID=UPI000A0F21DB|nr:C45 family peptidase [Maritimibacter sp. HL-12]SMH38432.1 Predicted choloylglycine hydrolase [Maritimibacter sp. HL-12]